MSEPERTKHRCPDQPRFPGDTVGCGSLNTSEPDEEGFCDCLDCGIWFTPEDDQRGPVEEKATPEKTLPPDPEEQNEDRAEWALQTLEFFRRLTRTDKCDAVGDLLADIAHLADRDPEWAPDGLPAEIWRASTHYSEETDGDGIQMGDLREKLAGQERLVIKRHVQTP